MFLSLTTELVLGAEPEELSLLYFLFYLQSGGGLESLTEFEGGAQQDHFVGGSQQVCDRLAESLGAVLRLHSAVTAVEHQGEEVVLHAATGTFRARHAIVAVSPVLAGRWHWGRHLSADRDALAQRMPMGAYMKVAVTYERPWWRDDRPVGHRLRRHRSAPDGRRRDQRRRAAAECWRASSPERRSSATRGSTS